jgi:hypothetical protein
MGTFDGGALLSLSVRLSPFVKQVDRIVVMSFMHELAYETKNLYPNQLDIRKKVVVGGGARGYPSPAGIL